MSDLDIPEIPFSQFLDELRVREERIPLDGTVETTFRCNLSCVHCYVNKPVADREARDRELSLARLKALVDEVAEAGCLNLLLTGGEVMVRSDFSELYLHAVGRGLRVTLFTNATMITERVLDLLASHPPACVEVSLYGATRETYERVTRVPGSFDKCMDGIRRLHGRGLPLKLKTMVLKWNRHEVDAMRAFAAELGVEFRHDGLLNARVDCGANRNPELQLSAVEMLAVDLADEDMRRRLDSTARPLAETPATVEPREDLYLCGAGLTAFTVDPYGALQLCQLSRRGSFDLTADTFARGWNEHFPALRARKWQSSSVCRSCSLLPVCGNCPGAAELEHGDPEAQVAGFCEITHARVHALLGDSCGHRADATCCLGRGQRPEGTSAGTSCGSCGHAESAPLLQIQPRRPSSSGSPLA
jgi:radical SAM protein with 4Fe4S-binding SPASM domain